jgi:hypothetical protein
MEQASISKYFSSTTTTASSSTSAYTGDEGGVLSKSTDGEQDFTVWTWGPRQLSVKFVALATITPGVDSIHHG